jgi:hypothetical protein
LAFAPLDGEFPISPNQEVGVGLGLGFELLACHEKTITLGVFELLHLMKGGQHVEWFVYPIFLTVEDGGWPEREVIARLHDDKLDLPGIPACVRAGGPPWWEGSLLPCRLVGIGAGALTGLTDQGHAAKSRQAEDLHERGELHERCLVEVERLAAPAGHPLTLSRIGYNHQENDVSYWVMVLFASIGAALILGALTFVSALIGGLINAMIVLMCGPLIDRMIARRQRRTS